MENKTDFEELLKYIDPAGLTYQEWVNVGMALKVEGYPVEVWEDWSAADAERYDETVFESKWESFNRSDITGGTIVQMARDRGWSTEKKLNVFMSNDKYSPIISWDEDYLTEEKPVFTEPVHWDQRRDLIKYLETVFEPGDIIGYTMQSTINAKGKYVPLGKGSYTHTAGELIDMLNDGEPIEKVFGSYDPKAGAWIRINPFDGQGIDDKNVTQYKNILVECDNLPVEEQIEMLEKIKIPIKALVYSGGKSVHAVVPVSVVSERDYRTQFNFIKNILKDAGMDIDTSNINPSRLSRLPGVTRDGHKQFLIKTNIGMSSFEEWKIWVSAMNDGMPDIENLREVWNNMPPLKPELIEGILRQGHKMIISSTSKAGKTFILMELAAKIAEGHKWLGHRCKQGKVLYINMELDRASFFRRFYDIYNAMGLNFDNHIENIDIWNLRGKGKTLSELAPIIINRMLNREYLAVMIDPLYKVLEGDENSNGDVARMVANFDRIAEETGAAVIYAHHFAKGGGVGKSIIDRASGAGTFARDPDAILTMTQLDWAPEIPEEEGWSAWRLESTLREFKAIKPVDLFFTFPIHIVDEKGRLADSKLLTKENNQLSRQEKNEQIKEIEYLIGECEPFVIEGYSAFKFCDLMSKSKKAKSTLQDIAKKAGYRSLDKEGYRGIWGKKDEE